MPPALAPAYLLRVLATLALALLAALACVALHTPLPWMIGPLLAVSLASVLGAPTASATPLRNVGQWLIGSALGLHFTFEVTALVASLWWAIALAIAWALALGWAFGRGLERVLGGHLPGASAYTLKATTYFAGAIGGASEMTLLAERAGARTDLVAAAHSLRLMLVTVLIPFAMLWSTPQLLPGASAVAPTLHLAGFVLLALAGGAGALAMRWAGRANPWFIGPLLAAIAITLMAPAQGWPQTGIPKWLTNAAQLAIAVSLGVRFTRAFVHTAPRWLGAVALGTLALLLASAAFGALLAWATGLPLATMVLGTSPGGITEMSITASVLNLGVPVVTAFQVCRLVAVLLLTGPLYRWRHARRAPVAVGGSERGP